MRGLARYRSSTCAIRRLYFFVNRLYFSGVSVILAAGSRPLLRSKDFLMRTYMCVICGFVYDEEKGLPDEGITPGTKWEDVPLNWKCPECGAGKDDFEMMEI